MTGAFLHATKESLKNGRLTTEMTSYFVLISLVQIRNRNTMQTLFNAPSNFWCHVNHTVKWLLHANCTLIDI